MDGDLVYVAGGALGLSIVDVANPHQPRIVRTVDTPGTCSDVILKDHYVLIAEGDPGILVLDVQNPNNPASVATFDPGRVTFLTSTGNLAATVGGDAVHLLDISNPLAISTLGSVSAPGSGLDLAMSGTHAYVGGSDGLRIIDVSNPAIPVEVGYWPAHPLGSIYSVSAGDSYAYVVDGPVDFEYSVLRVLDVSNPAMPSQVDEFYLYGGGRTVLDGDDLLLTGSDVQMYDVSQPGVLDYRYTLDSLAGAHLCRRAGSFVYGIDYSGLHIVDIDPLGGPAILASLPYRARDVRVRGNLAYFAGYAGSPPPAGNYGRFYVVNVSDPASPALLGSTIMKHGQALELAGDFAYVAMGSNGLAIIDISNPTAPVVRGSLDTPGYAYNVAVQGNIAYVADNFEGFTIVDITNPFSPVFVNEIDFPGHAIHVTLEGSTLYVSDSYEGMYVYDVSNPTAPALLTVVTVPGESGSESVTLRDNIAFISTCVGVQLYDVSNPAAPIPSGVIQVPCAGPGITFSGDMAYIVDYRENVVVVNIADLNSPWLVGSHVGAKLPFGLAIIGDRLYACDDRAAGIQVLPTQCAVTGVGEPAAATSRWFLSSPYPNPSSGPVSLAYTALKAVPMTLSVLNVSGCLVRRLDEPASSTGGRLVWDGRDDTGRPVLPGIYYLRLVQAGEAVVRKIVRVR